MANALRDSTSADKKRITMEEQKALGNAEFKAGNYEKAIGFFTKAIELEANHVLYSNRSACHCALKEYDSAAADAEKCIGMKADWGKGYARKGAALHGLGQFDASIAAYEEGLKVEPGLEMLKKGLADAQGAAAAGRGGGAGGGLDGLSNVFGAPDLIPRMAANPQTAGFLSDPGFMAKLEEIRRDPNAMTKHLSDQRVLTVMGMMMGIDIKSGPGGGEPAPAPAPAPRRRRRPSPKRS